MTMRLNIVSIDVFYIKTLHTIFYFIIFITAEMTNVLERRIDSCVISVYPSLNPDHETLTIPANILAIFGISAKVSKDGVAFNNADVIFHYQEILRDVHYTNFKPAYYLNRQFKLVCSEMNGRFLSNEYIQTVSYII